MAVCHRSLMPFFFDLNGFRAGMRRRMSPTQHPTPRLSGGVSYAREELAGGPLPNGRRKAAAMRRGDA